MIPATWIIATKNRLNSVLKKQMNYLGFDLDGLMRVPTSGKFFFTL